jgi:hypothetical protein
MRDAVAMLTPAAWAIFRSVGFGGGGGGCFMTTLRVAPG